MDLLLTHGYFLYEDAKELQIMKPYVPLGILYLASHLRAKEFDVEVFDTTFASRQELTDLLSRNKPGVVGIYANLMTRSSVVRILKTAKEAGWTTVVGGPESSANADEYIAFGADVVVMGEGEVTMEELLPLLRSGFLHQLDRVHGIAFRGSDGKIRRTPPRALIPDIDRQPWPSRESAPIEEYLRVWREHHGTGSVSVITARGCPYECRWCSHAVYGKTHRRRKPVSVADEVEWILDRYRPDMLWMADDVFTIHHGWLDQFAAEMKRRNLRVPFECISRADRLNPHVADLLADLGCFRIWIGSESGSQRVLDAMQRDVTVAQVQEAVAACRSRGIQTGMFLMWGYEGEELQDIEETISHVKRTRPDVFFTTVAYPIRGTPYFEDVADRVTSAASSWAEGSDRDFRIRGRHSRAFYQNADRLLRAEVELEKVLGAKAFEASEAPEALDSDSAVTELRRRIELARDGLQHTFTESEA